MTAYCIGILFHPLPLTQRLGRRCGQPDSHHSSYFKESPMLEGVLLDDDKMYPAHATYGDGTETEPEMIQHIRVVNWSCAVGF